MVSEAIINKQLTEQFPMMMETVNGCAKNEEKLKVVYQYIDILENLVKAIDGQDKTKY